MATKQKESLADIFVEGPLSSCENTVFPPEAVMIAINQALRLIVKGPCPEMDNTMNDAKGRLWHASASFRGRYGTTGVILTCRDGHYSGDPVVTNYWLPLESFEGLPLFARVMEPSDL